MPLILLKEEQCMLFQPKKVEIPPLDGEGESLS
jgi:hypothetical protein